MYDSTFGWRFPNPKMEAMFPLYGMGETAEEVQEKFKISREDQDAFAFASHQKAIAAQKANAFDQELVPVEVKLRKKSYTVEKDEGPREDTSLELLGKLRPAFRKDGSVTAGNSSSMNDGASLVCVVSEEFLKEHNLAPLVEITGGAVRGLHPSVMGLGPVEATRRLCKMFGKPISKHTSVYNTKHKKTDIEDTIYSILDFGNFGGTLEVNVSSEPRNLECSISILGEKGYIKIGGKALDKIEEYGFLDKEMDKEFDLVLMGMPDSLEANSYGTHAGSCPNHPTLYSRLEEFNIQESNNVISLIDEIYGNVNIKYYTD
jgi:hypothetical protein